MPRTRISWTGALIAGPALERLDRAIGQFAPFIAPSEPVGIGARLAAGAVATS